LDRHVSHAGKADLCLSLYILLVNMSDGTEAIQYLYRVSEKKLDPLLFHHIFALTATNCMKISRST